MRDEIGGRMNTAADGESALDRLLRSKEESFSEAVQRIAGEKGMTAPDIYGSVFMSKQLFHRIIRDRGYHPNKESALLIAMGLRLSLAETVELIGKAGYTLSPSRPFDIVVMHHIKGKRLHEGEPKKREPGIIELNGLLFDRGLPLISRCR